jgi:hypothetical protein
MERCRGRTTVDTADRDAHQQSRMDDLQQVPAQLRTSAEPDDHRREQQAQPAPEDTAWVEHTYRKLP